MEHAQKIRMKPSHLGLGILALCLLDCFATQHEWLTFPGVEGNPVMAWVITAWGWGFVWAAKGTLALIVLVVSGPLSRSLAGRAILWLALAVYAAICVMHFVIEVAS